MSDPTVILRREDPGDRAAIKSVHEAAFETGAEATLVSALRAEGLVIASHVTVEAGHVVGHALYSRMHIDTREGPVPAVALGPVAVLPSRCLLYTSPSPRDLSTSRMPSSA